MLKLLETEAVNYRHWVGQEEFIAMLGTSFLFPGLTGVKLAALIGYRAAGALGLIFAVLALNLPGLIMAIAGYRWLNSHSGPVTRKIMIGVQYGALALLAAATLSVAQGVIQMHFTVPIAIACVVFFLAMALWNLSPFYGFLGFIAVCYFLVR